MPNVVEQLRQIEGFDQLPPDRQEALIVESLGQEVRSSTAPPRPIPGVNPAYNTPMAVSPTTFHEGGTISRPPDPLTERMAADRQARQR